MTRAPLHPESNSASLLAPHLVRAIPCVALAPIVAIALLVALVSLLSAGAMTAMGAPMSAAWLVPSLEWTIRHEPLWVLTWMMWLAVPAALTVLVALLFRRVRGVRWWAWMLVGLAAWTGAAAARAYGLDAVGLAEVVPAMPQPYRLPLVIAGGVGGLVVAPLTAGLVRLLASLYRPRNGLEQRARPAPERGTNVSVRAS